MTTAAHSDHRPHPLWQPGADRIARSRLTAFHAWAAERHGAPAPGPDDPTASYAALHRWSVTELETFWRAVAEWFEVRFTTPYERVLADATMPGARWFPGATLNYAEHALRAAEDPARADDPALLHVDEVQDPRPVSWAELRGQVGAVAAELRRLGVRPGDRVSGYVPNIPQATVALLAAAAVGAVWTSCAPDFGARSVLDRFQQVEPVVLFTVDGYRYGGKTHDRTATVTELRAELPSLRAVVHIPLLGTPAPESTLVWDDIVREPAEPVFEQLPFDHPLWVLYSSGTTGLPKAIVQSQGGILLEHLKQLGLHCDIGPDDRFFWYTSTGWMMWNFLVSGLLVGATVVLYDGSPGHPDTAAQWRVAERTGTTLYGTSAAYVMACRKADVHPGRDFDLSAVKCVATTGSPLPPDGFRWIHDEVAEDMWIASVSGGTDVCSCFAGAVPTLPVYIGELQAPGLGTDLQAWDPQGEPVVDEVGELIVARPMPSMPVRFWNDPDGIRYRDSYFEMFPGAWRHGDWITLTSRGTVIIHGRSDSTLNRQGVRMGSADIYEAVERLPEIRESLVIGVEQPDGGYWMPLFVHLAPGATLNEELLTRIKTTIRTQLSPRHVPDEVIEVPGVPHTLTGKRIEVPVKRLLQGTSLDKAVNPGSVDDVELLRYYERLAQGRRQAGA
ncbi:acetoacetate--CoA ligase [Streptomyces rapamycinicus]|uniref:Acetoacetate-CoA ligase n=2 Tax=Streptomyces rapamycinicus TaxID=1226757 RepID=A0A0A0NUA1_STRRN|nr:acetoacetate--CoA ligase [Streptomyces rapamycinicus]AGP60108.1 acetoacetyl-CoA synthetase [Streptomyces rapamycinicus NRRL 5491]MBB4788734.1 acetoacetyl-CoA synthetase [Streptomyces rapamycinicus]RLV76708.1 acetoacetate-CoA ligase [Streptomyces rapamycinicus NRRL 5491]UTO67751.1 acetoacetate--CoA ligase [Streptomyces rapamycinicus]UTP35698.1 acetoacetate--CoA ligase [Streptomyces rapamycinicus NRRL 5491]